MKTKRNISGVTWIDLLTPSQEETRSVMDEYNIPPMAAHDLVLPTVRPKIENFGNFLYVVLHFPSRHAAKGVGHHEIDFCVGKNFILTARYENIDAFYRFEKIADVGTLIERNSPHIDDGGAGFLRMLLIMYQALGDELEAVKDMLDDIEDRIFKGEEKEMVFKLSTVSRELLSFRHALDPHLDILSKLETYGVPLFGPEFKTELEHVRNELHKVSIVSHRYHESLSELRRTNDSLLETKQSEIMKTFTAITVISSVLTIISSWFLVESPDRPFEETKHEFWYIGIVMFVVAIVLAFLMKKKKWL